jgi:2'-5' RNA ligase
MYRLFVAIDLTEDAKEAISCIRGGIPGVKWIDMAHLHLTLRFIGDTDDAMLRGIREELAGVKSPSFSLAPRGVGHFPPKRDPRVLWVGIDRNEALSSLQRLVEKALVKCGLEPEPREFNPHITLARLKDTPLSRITPFLEKNRLFSSPPVPVKEFRLYASVLSPRGAVHNRLVSYPLQE